MKFEWIGDLSDNCSLHDEDYLATVEMMDDNEWHASVYYKNEEIFHWVDDNIHPLTGKAARTLCETAIAAHRITAMLAERDAAIAEVNKWSRKCGLAEQQLAEAQKDLAYYREKNAALPDELETWCPDCTKLKAAIQRVRGERDRQKDRAYRYIRKTNEEHDRAEQAESARDTLQQQLDERDRVIEGVTGPASRVCGGWKRIGPLKPGEQWADDWVAVPIAWIDQLETAYVALLPTPPETANPPKGGDDDE